MRVICIKWGKKYGPDYVLKLQSMCSRHLPEHEFVCITENPVEGINCIPLVCELPNWWQKVGLFQDIFPGDNLYLDLDVVITGSLQPFMDAYHSDTSRLWALDDFSYSCARFCKDGQPAETDASLDSWIGGPGASTVNSSVMLWKGGSSPVWDEFRPEVMDELHGDQNWITRILWPHGLRLLPEGVAKSYKYGEHQKAPIVVFHGNPKPHEVRDEWVIEHWR